VSVLVAKLHVTSAVSGVEAMQQDSAFPWQQALKDAIEEPDPQRAHAKIASAEMAIFNRIQGFTRNGDFSEEHGLFDALETIRALDAKRRQELCSPRSTRKGFRMPSKGAGPTSGRTQPS
jgi:hypothetical protein